MFVGFTVGPLPEGMHLSTRTIVERTDADPTMLETHARLCAEEPPTRDELIVAGTALAVAIGQSEVSDQCVRRRDAGVRRQRMRSRYRAIRDQSVRS
jgi:hypothetical protein